MKTKDLNEAQPNAANKFWRLLGWGGKGRRAAAGRLQTPERAGESAPRKVLIVDDDQVFLKATSLKLKSAGYQPLTAADSAEALAVVADHQPELILVDINLPPDVANGGMVSWDGFRLVNWLRGRVDHQATKFAIISGTEGNKHRERAIESGAIDFLKKPLDFNRLFELLQSKPN
jgi:CheY-like chemotaxis protein